MDDFLESMYAEFKLDKAPDWVPWEGAAAIVGPRGTVIAWTTSDPQDQSEADKLCEDAARLNYADSCAMDD